MNNKKKDRQVNDYVLLFSAGAALGTIFLWGASYIFPEGEIVQGRRVFENIPKYLQYLFYLLSASSVFICGYLFSLRAKNWSRGTEEKRKVKLTQRVLSLFDGLLMRTLLRFKAAGLMHSMIYLGFLGLFLFIVFRSLTTRSLDIKHHPFLEESKQLSVQRLLGSWTLDDREFDTDIVLSLIHI